MNDQDFWQIVAKANHTARYQRFRAEDLEYHLSKLPPERIVEFDIHFHKLVRQAEIGDVYGAGCLLHHDYMSDDSFLYFRYWLISMGQVAYEQALLNPDSMAMLEIVHDRDGSPDVTDESYCYAIYDAYEKVTGRKIFDAPIEREENKNSVEPEDFNWMDYTHVSLSEKFPLLWNNYLNSQPDRETAYKTFTISSEGIAGE
ncbi:DUF4240 domain-containing protein [Undibacterium pigrum]|uniref:Uncharacterized protein DUF4240 n=1 Tax=Undibacterium pigrum TaxID=401470 RepID=A0A318IN46_9BURK|nr:DUF4240 domain-containing protein [Undibacterium pigrum]PXX35300.1 uncharacterized protein DUF4240 [Undibacterium pigrum]